MARTKICINKNLFKNGSQLQNALLFQTRLLEVLGYNRTDAGDCVAFEGNNPILVSDMQQYANIPGMSIDGGCYGFLVTESKLSELVPVAFPLSTKVVDELEQQKTWSEYAQVIEGANGFYIVIGQKTGNNCNHNVTDAMHRLYWAEFGIENLVEQSNFELKLTQDDN